MTKPTWKAENIRNMLDGLSTQMYGRSSSESIKQDVCMRCGKSAKEFKDDLSLREYAISGLCQECQDIIFVEDSV
jgi:hypothetical protein